MNFKFVPKNVTVWDNQGEKKDGTHDRYAVVFPDGACYTMSGFPFNEDGHCKFHSMNYKPGPNEIERPKVPSQVVAKIQELMV